MHEQIYRPPKNHFYVYIYCNPLKLNQPFYVGKGSGKRVREHLYDHPRRGDKNNHKHNTIKVIRGTGETPNVYCAWHGADEQQAFWIERFLIALWGRRCDSGILTNLTLGGEGTSGKRLTKSHIEAISRAHKGKKLPEHQKRLISETRRGRPSYTKRWQVTFPDGHVEVLENLKAFCREHGLSQGNLVAWGHTKGYHAIKICK